MKLQLQLRLLLPLAVAAALAAAGSASAQTGGQGGKTRECEKIPQCISVAGPWVAIPPRTEAIYLLDCPRRLGIVGGLDARASSRDVRVSFEGRLGSPVSPGTSTTRYALFRAMTVSGRRGLFRPFIGCIPVAGSPRATTSIKQVAPGLPLEYAQTTLPLRPGTVRRVTVGCVRRQRLVRSWHTVAFRTASMPRAAVAGAVQVVRTRRGNQVAVRITAKKGLPRAARAEVQIGIVCAS